MKVLILGAGKMVEAILVGLEGLEDLSDWGIYSPSGTSAGLLAQKVGAKHVKDLKEIVPERVWLGCKPQQLPELAKNLPEGLKKCLFVSLLAAISEEDQRRILGGPYLIRVMPNLNVSSREGVSLISSQSAKASEIQETAGLFGKLGLASVLSEAELEELTLLTGSGPALFYEFTQILAQSFQSLDEKSRETLARQVLKGAGINAFHETKSLGEMISAVTSKGGVTIAVLEQWRKDRMAHLIESGIGSGKKRTEELKALLRQS